MKFPAQRQIAFSSSRNLHLQPKTWQAALLSFLLLLSAFPVFSQKSKTADALKFIRLGKAQGLPAAEPTCVFQDSYGFIWLGTKEGLFRFDGYECKAFTVNSDNPKQRLSSNHIAFHAFYEDPDGNLWVATYETGFLKFNRQTEEFQHFRQENSDLNHNSLNVLCGDGKGGIWIGAKAKGLNHYHIEKDSFSAIWDSTEQADTLFSNGGLVDLHLSGNGSLWIGTMRGAAVRDAAGNFRRFSPDPAQPRSLSAGFVFDVFEDRSGTIWFATDNGLNRLDDDGKFTRFFPASHANVPKGAGWNVIQRVFEDSDGDFWVGTQAGLLRFDPGSGWFEPIEYSVGNPASIAAGGVHGIFQDNHCRLWFLSDGGVSILDKNTARFNEPPSLGSEAFPPTGSEWEGALSLAEAGGKFWYASPVGLFSMQPGKPSRKVMPGTFSNLLADRKGGLWAGTSGDEFYLLDPVTEKVTERLSKELKGNYNAGKVVGFRNTSFAEDRLGGLWAGTQNCPNYLDPDSGKCRQVYGTKSTANALLLDRNDNLWVATNAGVCRLDAAQATKPFAGDTLIFNCLRHEPGNPNSIANDLVSAIFEDSKGNIWFGTELGLSVLPKTGTWQHFGKKEGLPADRVTGILEDDGGNIWVSTANHGLAKLDGKKPWFNCFSMSDGLSTNQFNIGACLKMKDGKLVFGGVQGINCFDPANAELPHLLPPLYFTELRLNNQPVQPGGKDGLLRLPVYLTRKIVLAHHQKVITLRFAALDFLQPEKQLYRYKLERFDEDWQYLESRREVTFTNLFPGKYTLRVESSPNGYDWGQSSASMVIKVKIPPLWIILALVFAAIVYGFFRFRLRQKLTAAEARRLRELDLVKTKLYTNITHEFRTPLTVILGEADLLRTQAAEAMQQGLKMIHRNGRQLLDLVNQMLDLSKLESGSLPLRTVQADVILFLKYLLESFHSLADSKGITLHFQANRDEFFMDYDPERLRQILSNLLSNALKFTGENGQIWLEAEAKESDKLLIVKVKDNGRGIPAEQLPFIFDRFFQVENSTPNTGGTGIGLTLAKELAQLMGGAIEAESEEGKGATFTLALPVSQNAPKQVATEKEKLPAPEPAPVQSPISNFQFPPISNFQSTAPRLLVIEDNPDVTAYIVDCFAKDYQILTAANGSLGVELALREVPDLVLSDVMMPEMNGYEVCQRLKTEPATSHIPVVLLTAKADLDSRLEGLEHGADAYLAKPFERRELEVRLRKLLELRRALQERYRSQEFWSASQVLPAQSTTFREIGAGSKWEQPALSLDDVFLKKIREVLEEDMTRHWEIPVLAQRLAVSQSQLHRKLEALTGMHATEFLRHLRLLEAIRLLRERPELKISAIAYDVGFGSPSEFGNRFREVFHCSPKQWRERDGS